MASAGPRSADGVVISGLYGSGKSTVAEEMADLLEEAAVPYAALDLDWLWWFGVPGVERSEALGVLVRNLAAVTNAYLDAGATRFVMAWSLREPSDVASIRAALPFPITVVELIVPLPVIEARLEGAITAGRKGDLREAVRWSREGLGTGLGDIEICNDRPIRRVATEIVDWLGWL